MADKISAIVDMAESIEYAEAMKSCMADAEMMKKHPDEKSRQKACEKMTSDKMMESGDLETVDLNDVEIFSTGVWSGKGSAPGGDKITVETLNGWLKTFQAIGKLVKPRMYLSHDKDASGKRTGLPAIGWITDLKVKGEKLYADIKAVPKKIKQLIDARAYGRFSPGIYGRMNINGTDHFNVFEHLALLGAELPANMGIDGYIDLYEIENSNGYDFKNYEIKTSEVNMDYEKRIAELEAEVKAYTIKVSDIDAIKSENEKLKAEIKKVEFAKREAEVRNFLDSKVKEGKITPVQSAEYSKLLMGQTIEDAGEVKNYSSAFDIVKNIINGQVDLNMKAESKAGNVSEKIYSSQSDAEEIDENGIDNTSKIIDAKAKEFMKINNVSYTAAYKSVAADVMKEVKK